MGGGCNEQSSRKKAFPLHYNATNTDKVTFIISSLKISYIVLFYMQVYCLYNNVDTSVFIVNLPVVVVSQWSTIKNNIITCVCVLARVRCPPNGSSFYFCFPRS